MSLSDDLEARIKSQVDLPSPSRVAREVIELASNPDIELAKVANAISCDPAMAAKLLRIANSAFYAQRRPSQNIRQALVIIGLNAALTLALSFSLVSTLRGCKPNGIDYKRYWRRSLLAATGSRAFAEQACKGQDEDAFLVGLLQDVSVLAIDRCVEGFYADLPSQATHEVMVEHERKKLNGRDHAYYGALLLRAWKLPESICSSVERSHNAQHSDAQTPDGKLACCCALGSILAEAVLRTGNNAMLTEAARSANRLLGIRDQQFTDIVSRLIKLIPEAEELYETSILDTSEAEALMSQARELMTVRNLYALRDVQALQETASVLLNRTEELEDAARRDALTGTLNRMWLERMLEREYTQALMFSRSLSIALIDLDHFKRINESIGHEGGNRILKSCADIIQANIRGSDLVGRYSGDTFLVILPGTDESLAMQVCERILRAIRESSASSSPPGIKLSVSVGTATHAANRSFNSAADLIQGADHALYRAKLRGRNCVERFDELKMPNGSASNHATH
ncbi:MAG: GGDEF domain-containing protein [Steroidobacter sp.]